MATLAVNELPLAPLGAGDLIDRAVRLYRRHFFTLIRITAPPVVVSAVGSVMSTVGWRSFSATSSDGLMALYFALTTAGLLVWFCGNLLNVVVMGGATRNLVMHLLKQEPVSARTTYGAVRARFWGLLGATLVVSVCLSVCAGVAFIAWYFVFLIALFAAFAFATVAASASAVVGIIGFVVATVAATYIFFLLAGNFAYVPQVMLVEGKGVGAALGRSTGLARGNARRLMAITFFCSFATYSALMILIVPLGWYGYLNGIDPSPFKQAEWPAWYAVGYNVLWQSSLILLAPVWMLGLSLLYVDERVRHEGYDIELMASRQLGDVPYIGGRHVSPLAPAIVTGRAAPAPTYVPPPQQQPPPRRPGSMLGLS